MTEDKAYTPGFSHFMPDPDAATAREAGPSMSMEQQTKIAKAVREASQREAAADPEPPKGKGPHKERTLYFVRNAERLDRVFPRWTRLAFSDTGKYRPYDLNQPINLPKRGPNEYANDTPITEMGHATAQLVGRGMRLNHIYPTHVFSSPALRCIQTANGLLKTLNVVATIDVEPGLFEFLGRFNSMPDLMTAEQMQKYGYKVNTKYTPVMTTKDLVEHLRETEQQHYDRLINVVNELLKRNPSIKDAVIVGHTTALDAVPRDLLQKQKTSFDLERLGLHYPYCSVVAVGDHSNKWKQNKNAVPAITYLDFSNRTNPTFFNR